MHVTLSQAAHGPAAATYHIDTPSTSVQTAGDIDSQPMTTGPSSDLTLPVTSHNQPYGVYV